MITVMLLRMACKAIWHHFVRSLLTLLGIVIGISGIIAISAIGKGTQKKAREQFLAYGTKTVSISSGNWMSSHGKRAKPLLLDDIDIICQQCPSVQYISPEMYKPQTDVEYQGNTTAAEIVGVNELAFAISEFSLQQGAFFTQLHVARQENVAVIDPELAELFFKWENPCGKIIRIHKIPFVVIGVKAPPKYKGKWDGLGRPRIAIPFSTHKRYFDRGINVIFMSTYSNDQVSEVTRQVEKIFRALHRLQDGESNDFMIWDNQTFAAAAEEASKSVGLFAIIAALIALLVGGIGVMNIMLVAVQERTQEIGIKMALGASINIIRMQFLFEAIIICLIGGMLGIFFGVLASLLLNNILGIATVIEYFPIGMSFLLTAIIGLAFGLYPAEKAARLNPIKALTQP